MHRTCTEKTCIVDYNVDFTLCIYNVLDGALNCVVICYIEGKFLDRRVLKVSNRLYSTRSSIDFAALASKFIRSAQL